MQDEPHIFALAGDSLHNFSKILCAKFTQLYISFGSVSGVRADTVDLKVINQPWYMAWPKIPCDGDATL